MEDQDLHVSFDYEVGIDEREIWLDHEDNVNGDDLLAVGADFPSISHFPCMSSSSSSSSAPQAAAAAAPPPQPRPIACTSSSAASTASSASSSSWTGGSSRMKPEAEEDEGRKRSHPEHSSHRHCGKTEAAAISPSSGSVEMVPPALPSPLGGEDEAMYDVDCMDVMEDFGYMDLLEPCNWDDPSSGLLQLQPQDPCSYQQEQREQFQQLLQSQAVPTSQAAAAAGSTEEKASEDLAMVFLEWLKSNKESISAEDLRKIKLRRATIECAAKRLGGGKEGMKQLLKLILEWVQRHQLQKKSMTNQEAAPAPSLSHQQCPPEPFVQNPNPNLNINPLPSDFVPWASQPPQYDHFPSPIAGMQAPGSTYPAPRPPSSMGRLMGEPFCHASVAPNGRGLGSSPSWSASQLGAFPGNNVGPMGAEAAPLQHALLPGYGSQYPYHQPRFGQAEGEGFARLGASATKEARKKRMARQRRLSSYHPRHHHYHQQHNQQQAQQQPQQQQNIALDEHSRVGSGDFPQANPSTWMFWPQAAAGESAQPVLAAEAPPQTHHVERPAGVMNYQRQYAADRRQGWKPEKNLRFLLQKVLKQSDVGSLGRIVLPKKEAEMHLPELASRDGISIAMEDIGTSRIWNMRYRFWPNNKSRMYLLENTGDFVKSNGLQEGDFIVIYSDVKCGKYMIRGVKVRQQGMKPETRKSGKAQKKQHANANASSSSPTTHAASAPPPAATNN